MEELYKPCKRSCMVFTAHAIAVLCCSTIIYSRSAIIASTITICVNMICFFNSTSFYMFAVVRTDSLFNTFRCTCR